MFVWQDLFRPLFALLVVHWLTSCQSFSGFRAAAVYKNQRSTNLNEDPRQRLQLNAKPQTLQILIPGLVATGSASEPLWFTFSHARGAGPMA